MAKKVMIEKVIVEKDGKRLIVHPTCLEAHHAIGWNEVGRTFSPLQEVETEAQAEADPDLVAQE